MSSKNKKRIERGRINLNIESKENQTKKDR